MVIGDTRTIELTRYIGRQQQAHVVVHFADLKPDLGRKSFEDEVERVSQRIAGRILNFFGEQDRFRLFLKPSAAPPLRPGARQLQDWIFDSRTWAMGNQLIWPSYQLPMVSIPRQEQDVVILFAQLVALEILPGYRIYASATGNQQYDS